MADVIRGRRRAAGWQLVVGGAVALAALAGCGEKKYTYVANSADSTFMRVPNAWKVFEVKPEGEATTLPSPWQRAFDAAPKPTLDHFAEPAPADVAGRLTVFYIDAQTSDGLSSAAVRRAVSPLQADPLELGTETATVEGKVLDYRIEARDGGLKGSRIVYSFTTEKGKVTYDQTTLVDPKVYPNPLTGRAMFKVYALSVHCESSCYEKNQTAISDIVNSWQVTR